MKVKTLLITTLCVLTDDITYLGDLYHHSSLHLYQKLPQRFLIMTNNNLEMLTAREQLMEDIDCIITDYFAEYDVNYDAELVRILCDAVCRNFPSN